MNSSDNLDSLERWLNAGLISPENLTTELIGAAGVLAHRERTSLSQKLRERCNGLMLTLVEQSCADAQSRLDIGGADLGHAVCLAQAVLLAGHHFIDHDELGPHWHALTAAIEDVQLDSSATVVIEQWVDGYGFDITDPDLSSMVAVPLPHSIASLAHSQSNRIQFVLPPSSNVVAGDFTITQEAFRNAAGDDGDASELLRQRFDSDWTAVPDIQGLEIKRTLLPDWIMVIGLRGVPSSVEVVHILGLPGFEGSMGWQIDISPLSQEHRIQLLNAPIAVRFEDGTRLSITR